MFNSESLTLEAFAKDCNLSAADNFRFAIELPIILVIPITPTIRLGIILIRLGISLIKFDISLND